MNKLIKQGLVDTTGKSVLVPEALLVCHYLPDTCYATKDSSEDRTATISTSSGPEMSILSKLLQHGMLDTSTSATLGRFVLKPCSNLSRR